MTEEKYNGKTLAECIPVKGSKQDHDEYLKFLNECYLEICCVNDDAVDDNGEGNQYEY